MKNVAASIFIRYGYVLIAKRANNENLAGYWEFPGGKQEQNESIFKCLEREILEEFNVKCKANKIYLECVHNYKHGAINLIAILSDLLDSNIELTVHDDYRWIGDTLFYTGMGTKGDQSFDFMQNKTLFYSGSNGVSVYLFEVFVDTQYTYIGKVALAEEPFYEVQPDSDGSNRRVCVFPVKVIDGEQPFIQNIALEKNKAIKKEE